VSRWRDDPDGAADHLMLEHWGEPSLLPEGPLLLVEPGPRLEAAAKTRDHRSVRRRLRRGETGAVPAARDPFAIDVPDGFSAALLRLPKDKRELVMTAHLIAARLRPAGPLIVYGGNDEGIRSAGKALDDLGHAETVAARGHGRILRLRIHNPPSRGDLAAWRETQAIRFGNGPERPWVSYPGVFAGGGLDPATALLIAHLPTVPPSARVLDFACGTGIIAGALLAREPTIAVTGIDNDLLALRAAAENIPGATWLWATSLDDVPHRAFDLIVSNPPFHEGVREDAGCLAALIDRAPGCLAPGGALVLVTQRRFALAAMLEAHFKTVSMAADDGLSRVWCARAPLTPQPTRR
jgi:16S rRNA (guanine1207-N2)-methyltransferase